jgi:4-azaleucine resistance transporter AzlC
MLATQAGLSLPVTLSMSIFIFAGALQFAAVPLLMSGANLITIAATTLVINMRHIIYAVPLLKSLPDNNISRYYMIGALTDENYSILNSVSANDCKEFGHWICLINHSYWILGTLIGASLGPEILNFIPDIDFALTSLFTILAIDNYRKNKNNSPIGIGIATYLAAFYIYPAQALIISIISSIALMILLSNKSSLE